LRVLKVGAVWEGSGTLVSRVSDSVSKPDPQSRGLDPDFEGQVWTRNSRPGNLGFRPPLVWDRFQGQGWFGVVWTPCPDRRFGGPPL
jgi:hypothetical protein